MTDDLRALAGDPAMVQLAVWMSRALARRGRGLGDELESAALLGLAEAAASFDESAGASFRTHAINRIRGSLADELRRHGARGLAGWHPRVRGTAPVVSLDTTSVRGGRWPIRLAASIADPASLREVGWEIESSEWITATLAPLGRDGAILSDYLFDDACPTLAEVGVRYGISEGNISRAIGRALGRLRASEGPMPAGDRPAGLRVRSNTSRTCGCGRPIAEASDTGRCHSCAALERHRAARKRLRAEVDRRIAAVCGQPVIPRKSVRRKQP